MGAPQILENKENMVNLWRKPLFSIQEQLPFEKELKNHKVLLLRKIITTTIY